MSKEDFNLPLLRKVVEWAESEARKPQSESEWYQDTYSMEGYKLGRTCGTAYCIAGYVAGEAEGYQPVGWQSGVAMNMLGIDMDDAWGGFPHQVGLFDAGNTIEDVRDAAERIARKYGEEL
jgi:hypothetical protein